MSVAVLIPYRGGCPHRERALKWVCDRYEAQGYAVAVGHRDEGPWRKAEAVSTALDATNAEVLIIADADVWTGGLPGAVQAVLDGAKWSIPHRGVHRLTEAATARYMAGEPWEGLPLSERAYLGVECGGVFVIRREVYEDCPMDPRFEGFGGEDESLSFALRCLYGAPWRGKGHLVHLFHPPQKRMSRAWGSLEGRELRKRYARARHHPDQMRALMAETHKCVS